MTRAGRSVMALALSDRRSWLWFVIGGALLFFSSMGPSFPLAAWLAPVFLLRFVRTQRPRIGLPLLAVVEAVTLGISWHIGATLAFPGVVVGLLYTLAYVADRLIAPGLDGAPRTLVFPLAMTVVDFVSSRLAAVSTPSIVTSLFGFAGIGDSPGYTQGSYPPLVQLVSLGGIWGLTFLMGWFASTVNALWEHRFRWQPVRIGTLAFCATLVAVLIVGSVRLVYFPPNQPTVRVAAIAPRQDMHTRMFAAGEALDLKPGTASDRAKARAIFEPIVDDLFGRSEREAYDGAKIITWSETAAMVLEEDVPGLIERAAAVARQHAAYLQLGIGVVRDTDHYPFLDVRSVLLDPSGAIAWDYHKTHPNPGELRNVAPGPGIIPTIDTPYGRLGAAICHDNNYPELIRQAGQARVDIMLATYRDWEAIRVRHAEMTSFRAIENGFSIVRPAASGISTVVDPHGRVVARADSFSESEPTVVTLVASAGTRTLYAQIGDSLAYLLVAGFIGVTLLAFVQRRRVEPAVVPQSA